MIICFNAEDSSVFMAHFTTFYKAFGTTETTTAIVMEITTTETVMEMVIHYYKTFCNASVTD